MPRARRQRGQFFYFNGFNSAVLDDFSDSAKIVAARDFSRLHGYRFMPVSVDFREVDTTVQSVLQTVKGHAGEAVFCGSSMGGWLARVLQVKAHQQSHSRRSAAIGWNPAYALAEHAHILVGPQQNYVTFERYEWTEAHSENLRRLDRSVNPFTAIPWFVYMDREDEVIPWLGSKEWHEKSATVVVYDGGCHSFDHYQQSLDHFAEHWLGDSRSGVIG